MNNPLLKEMLGTSVVRTNAISWQDKDVQIELLRWFQESFGITYQFDPLKKKFDECEQG